MPTQWEHLVLTSLLGALAWSCATASGDFLKNDFADCKPDIPPLLDSNASMVQLQMHQWVWIENLTSPDWAPRTDSGGMFYELLRPGFVRQQRLLLRTLMRESLVYVNVSFVTNGETLCAAAVTVHRNRTTGLPSSSAACNRICHDNFTQLGTRANLPLLVYDDWGVMSRFTEYLAFDALDPESRASYTCMGSLKDVLITSLPSYLSVQTQCPEGDECLFNYDNSFSVGLAAAGCKSGFREYDWCVSDMNLCSYNRDGNCPVCCRGNLCNREVAEKAYQRWRAGKEGAGLPAAAGAIVWAPAAISAGLVWLNHRA